MSTYFIGDLQGCHDDFRRLLDQIRFDPASDHLLLAGDLVNRGPQSLEVLRFVRSLGERCHSVLGNHDLHLLAASHDRSRLKPGDTVTDILDAPDAAELLAWLAALPLAWHDTASGVLMIHAGLPPQWDVPLALQLAAEASAALQGAGSAGFFARMYGDEPLRWDDTLTGDARLRFVINCFTRLRYCQADGSLALRYKGAPGTQPEGVLPWFAVPGRRSVGTRIVFGHWSTLGRVDWPEHGVTGLDTGCVWGGRLTALEIGSGKVIGCACADHRIPGVGGD